MDFEKSQTIGRVGVPYDGDYSNENMVTDKKMSDDEFYGVKPKMYTKAAGQGKSPKMSQEEINARMGKGVPAGFSSMGDTSNNMSDNTEAQKYTSTKKAAASTKKAAAKQGTMKQPAKMAKGKGMGMVPMGNAMAVGSSSGSDLGAVTTSLNNLNNTIKKTLTAIESRLKKNDVNPALTKMNDILGEINDSMPEPASGGGYSRRFRVKKGKKMSRKRNTA
jgi:hypothetical protein